MLRKGNVVKTPSKGEYIKSRYIKELDKTVYSFFYNVTEKRNGKTVILERYVIDTFQQVPTDTFMVILNIVSVQQKKVIGQNKKEYYNVYLLVDLDFAKDIKKRRKENNVPKEEKSYEIVDYIYGDTSKVDYAG